MTAFQLVSLSVLAVVCLSVYGPLLLPKGRAAKTPPIMAQIESVFNIREVSTNPKVKQACSDLLSALLQ